MAYMDRIDFKDIANARISTRLKQALVLVLAIIIGILISVSVNANESNQQQTMPTVKAAEVEMEIG